MLQWLAAVWIGLIALVSVAAAVDDVRDGVRKAVVVSDLLAAAIACGGIAVFFFWDSWRIPGGKWMIAVVVLAVGWSSYRSWGEARYIALRDDADRVARKEGLAVTTAVYAMLFIPAYCLALAAACR